MMLLSVVKYKVWERSIPARFKHDRLLRVHQKGPKTPRRAGWEQKESFIKSKSEASWGKKRNRSTRVQKNPKTLNKSERHEQRRRGEQTWNKDNRTKSRRTTGEQEQRQRQEVESKHEMSKQKTQTTE